MHLMVHGMEFMGTSQTEPKRWVPAVEEVPKEVKELLKFTGERYFSTHMVAVVRENRFDTKDVRRDVP